MSRTEGDGKEGHSTNRLLKAFLFAGGVLFGRSTMRGLPMFALRVVVICAIIGVVALLSR